MLSDMQNDTAHSSDSQLWIVNRTLFLDEIQISRHFEIELLNYEVLKQHLKFSFQITVSGLLIIT